MNAARPPRVVMITEALPEALPRHAGGRLLLDVVTCLDPAAHLTVVVPHGASVDPERAHPRIDELVVVEPAPGWQETAWQRRVHTYVRTGRAEPWFVERLAASGAATRAVAAADLVDLQWQEQAALVPWVRRVNPGARVSLTLHDVLSQVAERLRDEVTGATVRNLALRARWEWARRRSLRTEARVTGARPGPGTPDALAVLSGKDALLLPPGPVPVTVLTPALGDSHTAVERSPSPGPLEILMVALMSRAVNRDGLLWFLENVLPLVRRRHPDVRVRVAGAGVDPALAATAREHGVELLGFVPDLDPLYRTANAVVVPLRVGGGLKFKTVEALAAGVPVVSTPVGAEGVGPGRWFAGVEETAVGFAEALLAVGADQPAAERRSAAARDEVAEAYGAGAFRNALERLHGSGEWPREQTCAGPRPSAGVPTPGAATPVAVSGPGGSPRSAPQPESTHRNGRTAVPHVSVVVPSHNAAATIGTQLESLSRQVAAPPFEVVVVDNRSTDGTAAAAREWAAAFPGGLRVVPAPARQGVSHARNRGCHAARAERILICDADDRVQENWVREMAAGLDRAAVVGSDAVPVVDGVPQEQETGLRRVLGTDYLLCGALGIHRSAWAAVGGFDEAFPAGHEDVDFCRRLADLGYVLHPVHSTAILYTQRTGTRGRARQAFHYATGQMLLWTRLADAGTRHPVSFTGSVREAVVLSARAWRIPARDRGHALGWAWGIVAGHVRYRVLGRPPAPLLWPHPIG